MVHTLKRVLMLPLLFLTSLFWTGQSLAAAEQVITFPSTDNLLLTADSYTPHTSNTTPVIVLFHQAGSSRGEYDDIAPKLNTLGFNCLAVDLRSGEFSRGKDNETAIRASKAGLAGRYVDALPDVIAALQFARTRYPDSKVIAWGSSYSASLALKVAGDHPELADAVIAFSPGEYFSHLGQSKTWIRDAARNIRAPVFITSSKDEAESWQAIYEVIPSAEKVSFLPATPGRHGARALWGKYDDSTAYWTAVTEFLDRFKALTQK
jgi:pimeloyl-ACP methyl ester carboxylesterase